MDVVLNPLVGGWSDRTTSRWGPRVPWMLRGAVLLPSANRPGGPPARSAQDVLDAATAQDSTSQNVFQVSVSDDGVNFTAPIVKEFEPLLLVPIGFVLYVPFSVLVVMGQEYLPNRVGTASGVTLAPINCPRAAAWALPPRADDFPAPPLP